MLPCKHPGLSQKFSTAENSQILSSDQTVKPAVPVESDSAHGVDASVDNSLVDNFSTVKEYTPKFHPLTHPKSDLGVTQALARPVHIGTFNWLSAGAVSSVYNVYDSWVETDAIKTLVDNRMHLRGTLCVMLTSNTTPHHYGRMWVVLRPKNPKRTGLVDNFISASSSDNGLFMDASTANTITLKLQHSFPMDYFNLANTSPDVELRAYGLSTIRRDDGGVVGTPAVQMYAWMEDAEVSGITPWTTAGPRKPSGRVANKEETIQRGRIGTDLYTMARAADVMTHVPMVSWYASGISSMFKAMGDAATALGWSRPLRPVSLGYTSDTYRLGNTSNTYTVDEAVSVSLSSDASYVNNLQGVGAPPDPLHWDYLIRRFGLVANVAWGHSGTSGTSIGRFAVHPSACIISGGFRPTPLAYFSTFAGRWAGTIDFRIMITATPYIKGSLLVLYTPQAEAGATPSISEATSKGQYCVINLDQECDKIVSVKWHSALTNKLCGDLFDITGTSVNVNGYLHFIILDPIVAPASTGVDLVINVYNRAGDDFVFIDPNDEGVRAYSVAGPQDGEGRPVDVDDDRLKAQVVRKVVPAELVPPRPMRVNPNSLPPITRAERRAKGFHVAGPVDAYTPRDVNDLPDDITVFGYDLDPAFAAHNEVIPSFRTLLKRYWPVGYFSNSKAGKCNKNGTGDNNQDWSAGALADTETMVSMFHWPLYPRVGATWYGMAADPDTISILNPWYKPRFDPFQALACCFVGMSGGMRYKVMLDRQIKTNSTGNQSNLTEYILALGRGVPYANCDENNQFGAALTNIRSRWTSYNGTVLASEARYKARRWLVQGIAAGSAHTFHDDTKRVVTATVNIPYVSSYRYEYCSSLGNDAGLADPLEIKVISVRPRANANFPEADNHVNDIFDLHLLASAGEDFSTFFFHGVPYMNGTPADLDHDWFSYPIN